MKFVTYEINGEVFAGVLKDDYIFSFKGLSGKNFTMLEFIKEFSSEKGISFSDFDFDAAEKIPLTSVKLLSPIPYPFRNVICLGKNYSEHVKELAGFTGTGEIPEKPIYFTKSAYPAVGPDGIINLNSKLTSKLDYEVELAVVIGKGGKNIKPENVYDHIFGYTILNDISARDLQREHKQWFRGKSLDGTCPIGPVITYRDDVSYPVKLNISSRVNGETRQSSNTENMIFDLAYCIAEISEGMHLNPGDIIATGTPSGVGQGFDPPIYLKKGDVVECEIEGIGILKNTVNDI